METAPDLDRRIERDLLDAIGQLGIVPGTALQILTRGNATRIHLALRRLEAAGRIVYVRGVVRGWALLP